MLTLQIALRNVFRHRTRSLITIAAIAFGASAIIFVGGFFEDILYKMQESYIRAHTGHLQVSRRGFAEHGGAKPFEYLIDRPDEFIPLISAVEGVAYVTKRLQFAALLSTGDNTIACFGQGIEPEHERALGLGERLGGREKNRVLAGSVIEAGEPLQAGEPYTAILGKGLAAGIGAKPGDALILVANTIAGSINAVDIAVKGVFFTSSKTFDDYALRLPLATAQQLLQSEAVQTLVVMLDRTGDTPQVRRALEGLIRERGLDLEIASWEELSDFYVKSRKFFHQLFFILKLVVAIIVILSIYNTMNMAVLERTKEIGTMMALGTSPRGVIRLFLCEGAALGVIGGLAGLAAGSALTALISRIGIPMPPPPGATIIWTSEPIVVFSVLRFAFGLSFVTSLISSWYPARCASRLEIAQALRHT